MHLKFARTLLTVLAIQGGLAMAAENPHQPEIDRAAADEAVAKAQKAAADAQKAQTDAEMAAAKAKVGEIPPAGFTGTADVSGTGAGGAEATLLAARSVRELAAMFAPEIKAKVGTSTVLVFTPSTLPDFQALSLFTAQLAFLRNAYDTALQAAEPSTLAAVEGPATLGLGLDAASKLLAFAKTDYKFVSMSVTTTDAMLAVAVTQHLAQHGLVLMPGVYSAELGNSAQAVQKEVTSVLRMGAESRHNQQKFEKRQAALEKQAGATPNDTQKAEINKMKEAAAAWKAVADTIDNWVKQVSAADDKGTTVLSTVLRQGVIKQKLDEGAFLLVVQLHAASGGGYTEKNLWSSLGRNPFYVMAGAVGGYTLMKGQTGQVVASSFQPHHGGYLSVDNVNATVNN